MKEPTPKPANYAQFKLFKHKPRVPADVLYEQLFNDANVSQYNDLAKQGYTVFRR